MGQTPGGYPARSSWGGYPAEGYPGRVPPWPDQDGGYPGRVPPWQGTPLGPGQDVGNIHYTAGGMPLAFTQEDFLVSNNFFMPTSQLSEL